jgi:hypothetical protein
MEKSRNNGYSVKNFLISSLVLFAFFSLVGCSPKKIPSRDGGTVNPIKTPTEIRTPIEIHLVDAVSGIVSDEEGKPIEKATVRLQGTSIFTTTNSEGFFILNGILTEGLIRLTAFSPGYFINKTDVTVGTSDNSLTLEEHTINDNLDYVFLTAGFLTGTEEESVGCAKCHSANPEEAAQGITFPFDEWSLDAHSTSAQNPRFLSMYNGTDLQGNQSPLTTFIVQKDYGLIPLRPTLGESYFGPGFKLDFPQNSGNCASCHTPIASINAAYDTDPNSVTGTGREGINCDFCHKIWGVILAGDTGMPNNNMPGVLSFNFRRPSGEHQLFIGPYDDVAPGEDTFSPLQNQSAYCAPCHFGSFWDTKIYNSYGEWLESPYSDNRSGKFRTCQDCHMPPVGTDHFARLENGALIRDPATIFSHRMPGASDVALLQNTVDLEVTTKRDGDLLTVSVSVYNANAGHHIPTDSPLRQILLSVEALDKNSNPLPLISGPLLPDWTGNYKNTPGLYFAKILEELWTEVSPSAAYWMQTRILEDTRLAALETRKADFVFKYPSDSSVTIDVTLIFRRAFQDLMEQKGWNTPDILMEQKIIELP